MNRRSAVTLTEVLIAIFVMALGLMSILALFPLGAVQMAQALKDQRSAEAAANAAAWFRMAWKDACESGGQGQPDLRQRFVIALNSPNQSDTAFFPSGFNATQNNGAPPTPPPALQPISSALASFGPGASSYPVFVDPVGWHSNGSGSTPASWWLAAGDASTLNVPAVPRRPFYSRQQAVVGTPPTVVDQFVRLANPQPILRRFSLLDDMTFTPDGKAQLAGTVIERQGKYTWAYMVRRPNNLVARQIDLTVVVYSGRSIDVASQERAYAVTFDPTNPTALSIGYGGAVPKPALRRGWWVLDATMMPMPQGYFYRVVNVNDDTAGVVQLELQTPVRAIPGNPTRLIVVLDNVVEVFEKGTIDPKEEIRPF